MQNGKVLLQKATNDTGFAFPGGHTASHGAASPATGFAFIIEITDESTQRNAVFAAKEHIGGAGTLIWSFTGFQLMKYLILKAIPITAKNFF